AFAFIGYAYYYLSSNSFITDRLSERGGSGRDMIYSNIINGWFGSENILNFLFGYGFNSSIYFSGSGNLAHNDWLELIINYGFIGFFIYLLLFIRSLVLL